MSISERFKNIKIKGEKEELEVEHRAVPMFIIAGVFLIIGLGLFFFWRSRRQGEEVEAQKIRITATSFPIYDLAQRIVGDAENVDLRLVLSKEKIPSSYDFSGNSGELKNSDLILKVGAGVDDSVDKISKGSDAKDVDLSRVVELKEKESPKTGCEELEGKWLDEYSECEGIERLDCEKMGGKYENCASACRHDSETEACIDVCVEVCTFDSDLIEAAYNPYYFLSVDNAKLLSQAIYSEIAYLRPDTNDLLYNNLNTLWTELDKKKSDIKTLIDDAEVLKIYATSEFLEYMGEEYGFEVEVVEKENEGQNYKEILEKVVRNESVTKIICESSSCTKELKEAAGSFNLEVAEVYPWGTSEEIESYFDVVDYVVEVGVM